MRLLVATLLGFLITSPVRAQVNQNAEPPAGQTLLNGLIGKDQSSPSKAGKPLFGGSADQETQEQREHYRNKDDSYSNINKSAHASTDDKTVK